ncbi:MULTISPECIES: FadR/GntR family transcriptional regulator [Streptomyces]|uniref:FadR/GntR family transcriptional regulator n=1 Tax=Streptomyces TaxID=1883 RepID=UPI0020227927|nr:FCD domain-containing protein [Streptomyces sp. MCA2]MCL7494669.1 FCD domain-containing protein [Streptomyces sp. MCA2]
MTEATRAVNKSPQKRNAAALRVRVPKTAELVAASLRRVIIRGELEPGDALPPESALMEQFGISRPTLREAIRVLESEALISVRRGVHGGARVNAPDPMVAARYLGLILEYRGTTLGEMFQLVASIEPPCVRQLAGRHTPSGIGRLHEALATEEEAKDDPAALAEAKAAFHATLVELNGNRAMLALHETLQCIFYQAKSPHIATGGKTGTRRDHEEHVKLVKLIQAGEADEAEAHWRRHISRMEKELNASGANTRLELLD